jgi:hypothetical protein
MVKKGKLVGWRNREQATGCLAEMQMDRKKLCHSYGK